ncbi:enoyl-CoA hydratase/isomerase family protein [Cryobacterium levicorallinum]|uniref:Enoyl-CoA hydratase n=1 Tax=Cryobacterium levicorallinum TaxID=995038 RepID=A0A1I3API9_9MICO|nr:enoyl-CoA hydratase/isomerase family protein [Cryobacterium levicorallinum]TFB88056.1 enoyl-CoA hydratase/isomerase family protein [Cryobacterium levicorallinum]GEP26744.1 hypothetical protein CLE01_13420 [Cryobacterium levicorallinum]SFH51882.1 enoyl-CoA hydratase [Cryobacterium levicorallinum]
MTSTREDILTLTENGTVATLRIGSGARFNALGIDGWRELEAAAQSLSERPELRAVVVRGTGPVFCAGNDLREWESASAADVSQSFAAIEGALQAVENLPVPTVAVVEGVATGGGCQLALSCDLQLVSSTARLGMPIARLGILAPASFANRLSLRVGPSHAKALLFGTHLLSAERAERIGLVTTLVPEDEIDTELAALLDSWSTVSAASLRAAKAAVDLGLRPLAQPARQAPMGLASDPQEFSRRVSSFLHHTA